MQFHTLDPLSLIACPSCQGSSSAGRVFSHCRVCAGFKIGYMDEGVFVFYNVELTRFHAALRRGRHGLHLFERIGALMCGLSLFGMFVFFVFQKGLDLDVLSDLFLHPPRVMVFFWSFMVFFLFLWYRTTLDRTRKPTFRYDERKQLQSQRDLTTWNEISRISRRRRRDLARYLSDESEQVLARAYAVADKAKSTVVGPEHIFLALLEDPEIRGLFVRLQVSSVVLQSAIVRVALPKRDIGDPRVGDEFFQTIFLAYTEARRSKRYRVGVTELLLAAVGRSKHIQEALYDSAIEQDQLKNMVEWLRIREKLRIEYHEMRSHGASRNRYGLDRAMTAVATPFLNSFSIDLTAAAQYGNLDQCVAREHEIDEIFRIIEGGRQSIVLVGDHGVGKMSVIGGIAQRMVAEDIPKRLADKRLLQLSVSSLLAGTTVSGAQERLIRIMSEIRRAGNIILFIPNIQDLIGGSGIDGGEGLDVSGTLAEYLSQGHFLTFATATTEGYNKYIIHSEVGQVFARVAIEEMSQDQAVRALESKAGVIEYHQKVFFSYDALAKSVMFAKKFLHDQRLPESAVELLTEAASYTHNHRGDNMLVSGEDVAAIVGEKTGIPTTAISDDESTRLLHLEEAMHHRVIGQDEAVALVANALRRARADVGSSKRPIANFLFLGPTGVGKTELAKTIAEVYFGGESRMIRVDMSEYQDATSIYRMIGQPGAQGTGILTEAVRQQPFSLVLLDELEKADTNVLNLFLQVFDDGRLTDSTGRTIDFTNTIIIATSNAGTTFVQEQIVAGASMDSIREALVRGELRQYYKPEFLNRFDGIVLFKPLTRDEIKQVAGLMLKSVGSALEAERGVELQIGDGALDSLADVGFDPQFGARPMRRAIQDRVQNALAELLLQGKLKRRDVVIVGEGLKMLVKRG